MKKPWISGPEELLTHGLEHLKKPTDFDGRMALICIDNSVELTLKTYLGLSSRATGIIGLSKTKYDEICQSFSKLVGAIEEHAKEKLVGIEIDDIEWFHRLRNEIYHKGNGITVERSKLESYSELAIILFQNIFEVELEVDDTIEHETLIGKFIKKWINFEKTAIESFGITDEGLSGTELLTTLRNSKIIDSVTLTDLKKLYSLRNSLIYDDNVINIKTIKAALARIGKITQTLIE